MIQPPTTTKFTRYPKILLYGLPGLGKSSFASECPKPVFIATTDGLEGLAVEAFPVAKTAQDVRDAIEYLLTSEHQYKTVVIDTIGWLEKLVHDEVCATLNLEFMTQSSMKSYPLAALKLREIKDSLDRLNKERKMMVLIIGHATVSKFEDPTTASYDRYALQMNEKVAEMFMQDVDIVAFMNQKVTVREEKEGFSKVKKASGSARYAFFDPCPAYYAKDHGYGLPSEILLEKGKSWSSVWQHMKLKLQAQKEVGASAPATKGDLSGAQKAQRERREEKAKKEAEVAAKAAADDLPASFTATE